MKSCMCMCMFMRMCMWMCTLYLLILGFVHREGGREGGIERERERRSTFLGPGACKCMHSLICIYIYAYMYIVR